MSKNSSFSVVSTNNSITWNPKIPRDGFFSSQILCRERKKFNLFLIDCQSCKLITVLAFLSSACIENAIRNIFYIYDFFANPFKPYFRRRRDTRKGRERRWNIYFLLFKTKLIASHGSPYGKLFFHFPSLCEFSLPLLNSYFCDIYCVGPHIVLLREHRITGWDNLLLGRWKKEVKSAADSVAASMVFAASSVATHMLATFPPEPKHKSIKERSETCKWFWLKRMYCKARGGGGETKIAWQIAQTPFCEISPKRKTRAKE